MILFFDLRESLVVVTFSHEHGEISVHVRVILCCCVIGVNLILKKIFGHQFCVKTMPGNSIMTLCKYC
jgi:hypothetical protein